ncbi:MAG TPA: type II secretion system F family protein [Anaerohalosphaeraceae bacterium]|nr:type II secretion system F family protein [Anaerohalosphaeraceae bacterium]
MALFEYRSCTKAGRLMTGTIEAANIDQARISLEELGLQVTELEQAKPAPAPHPVGRSEFMLFNEQLASLTKAGIPLERGLRELAHDAGSGRMKSLLNSIADDLEQGIPIDKAIEKRQKHFPPLYNMIFRAGIETGRLHEMLANLNRHLQVEHRTRRIVIEAISYPLMILLIAAILVTFLFTMVVPAFAELMWDMSDGRLGLPMLTVFLLNLAEHIWSFWIGAGILIGGCILFWIVLSASPEGRQIKEKVLDNIPLLGRVYRNGLMSRFAESLSALIKAGCTMDTAVELAGQSSGSERLKQDCVLLAGQLREGFNVMEAGLNCSVISHLFLYSVQLGSQRNELRENLDGLAQLYAAKTYTLQSQLQAVLMPLLIILLGGIIGLIILSLFLPMVKITQVLM